MSVERRPPPLEAVPSLGPALENELFQVLVVADRTAVGSHVTRALYELMDTHGELSILVIVPARHRDLGDEAAAPDAAGVALANRQLARAIELLRHVGADVGGMVGPSDPLDCIRMAIETHRCDHVVVSTVQPHDHTWVTVDLRNQIESRFGITAHHVMGPPMGGFEHARPQRPVRMLVIDDQPDDVDLIIAVCARIDPSIEVTTSTNGVAALASLRTGGTERPDVVLVDLVMPGMSGYEFMEHVRDDPELQNLYVAVVTSSDRDEDWLRARSLGASAYLVKELDVDRFAEGLGSLVDEVAVWA